MLEDKGIHWLIEGFKLALKQNNNLILLLAGPLDKENPTTISNQLINEINRMKAVKYLGNVKDSHVGWLNLDMKRINELTKKSIDNKNPVWFGCDVGNEWDR